MAISQADPTKIVRINPIPLKPLQKSFLPATLTTDLRNNRIYVWDFGAGKVAAVDFTQDGNMSVAWLQDQRTLGFMPLIGPADKRVLVGTNINPTSTLAELKDVTYTEQVLWRERCHRQHTGPIGLLPCGVTGRDFPLLATVVSCTTCLAMVTLWPCSPLREQV